MNYKISNLGKRFFASLIDGLIVSVFVVIIMFLMSGGNFTKLKSYFLDSVFEKSFYWISLSVSALYGTIMVGAYGATIGKKIEKIRVVAVDNTKISYSRAFVREAIGKYISNLIFIGYLWALFDKKNQTLHDKIARTLVVEDSR